MAGLQRAGIWYYAVARSTIATIVAPFSAVGRLLLQARLPGTRCQTISVIRRLAKTLLGDY